MLEKTIWILTENFNVEVLNETEKAYLVLVHEGPDWLLDRQAWMPKKCLQFTGGFACLPDNEIREAVIPTWYLEALRKEYAPYGGN